MDVSNKDENSDNEEYWKDYGSSSDQYSDDTDYDNETFWDEKVDRRYKRRKGPRPPKKDKKSGDVEDGDGDAPRDVPEEAPVDVPVDVPKGYESDDSWGPRNESVLLPRNDERMNANNEIDANKGSRRDVQSGNQNRTEKRGESIQSRPAVPRDSRDHSTAPPVNDNTLTNTSRHDAIPAVRRDEDPHARRPTEHGYEQRPQRTQAYEHPQQMTQAGYQAPLSNQNYGYSDQHHSNAPPRNQQPNYPQEVPIREMSDMSISRGNLRRVPKETSSMEERRDLERWDKADLGKELKELEERTRAIMNVLRKNGVNPEYLECSDISLSTPSSRAISRNNKIHRDGHPPSDNYPHHDQHQPPSSDVVQQAVLPQPQQSRGLTENQGTYDPNQQQQYTAPPSYAPPQPHNYPQVPPNWGSSQEHQQYQDPRQPVGDAYPPQQNHEPVYATPYQHQHQQYNAPPSNAVPHSGNHPQNMGGYQQNQAYPHQASLPPQSHGPAVYATNSQQPHNLQYNAPPSNAVPHSGNHPQNMGGYQQNQAYPHQASLPPQSHGPAVYATNSQQPHNLQYNVPPANVAPHTGNYPQNMGGYQQNQAYPPQASLPPQSHGPAVYGTNSQQSHNHQYTVPPANFVPHAGNYPQNSGDYHQTQGYRQVHPPQQSYGSAEYRKPEYHPEQQHYAAPPAREVTQTQQYSGYSGYSHQQAQPYQSAVRTMATAPQHQQQPHNYPYVPQNAANHHQLHYQDSRQPLREVTPTQQYPAYSASANYQQPQQHHASHVASHPHNYNYVPQNAANHQQQHYQDSRQPLREVTPTQHYPTYSASHQQPQQQQAAASHVKPQHTREEPQNTSYGQTEQPPTTVPQPQKIQESTHNIKNILPQQQASLEPSAAVPTDTTKAEAPPAPSPPTDSAPVVRYNKKGKLIIEPTEEVRQWHMNRRKEERAAKAAIFRETEEYKKLQAYVEATKAARESEPVKKK